MRNNLRLWVIGSVAVMAALLAGGWFVGVQPFLAAASDTSDAAAQVAASNQAAQIRLAGLAKQASHLDQLQAQEQAAAAAIPATLGSNSFVDRVNAVAALRGVTVQTVSPGDPQAYAPPASVAAAQAAVVAAQTAAASPSASPSPTPAPAVVAPAVPVLAASDPSITAANLTVIPMSVSVKGGMEGTLRFVHDLQHDQRLFLVSSYALSTQGQSGSSTVATLNGFVYTLKH